MLRQLDSTSCVPRCVELVHCIEVFDCEDPCIVANPELRGNHALANMEGMRFQCIANIRKLRSRWKATLYLAGLGQSLLSETDATNVEVVKPDQKYVKASFDAASIHDCLNGGLY